MSRQRSDGPACPSPHRARTNTAAITISLVVHALVLASLAPFEFSDGSDRFVQAGSAPGVTYFDLPQLTPIPPADPSSGDSPATTLATDGSYDGQTLSRDVAGAEGGLVQPAPSDRQPSISGAESVSVRRSAASALRAGFRDTRLQIRSRPLRAPLSRSTGDQLDEHFEAALRADNDSLATARREALDKRQATVLGRRITVFGDTANSHWRRFKIGNERVILPIDGREWQDAQMKRQRDDFVRDSILRARARATRERIDSARRAAQDQ